MSSPLRRALLAVLALALACAPRARPPAAPPPLTAEQVARLLPPRVADRAGWAEDVVAALTALELEPQPERVCQVLAVIEQESGFEANPPVRDLARIVRRRLDAYADKLGPLGPPLVRELLSAKPPYARETFGERLERVRTERDLDRVFREMLAHYEAQHPVAYRTADLASSLFTSRGLADLNPITTAGPMQVSVRFAEDWAREKDLPVEPVRDDLYTRRGGVYFGAARLLSFEAGYTEPLYRFADYNAGVYASRNAALQAQLSRLTGLPLATDGDLLRYDSEARPLPEPSRTFTALLAFRDRYAPDLSERQLRRDAEKEKTRELEETRTWEAVRKAYRARTGEEPAYAQLPDVALQSPKLSRARSTAWFARSVQGRYEKCLARHAAP